MSCGEMCWGHFHYTDPALQSTYIQRSYTHSLHGCPGPLLHGCPGLLLQICQLQPNIPVSSLVSWLAYFLFTKPNCSRNAWELTDRAGRQWRIRNWQRGGQWRSQGEWKGWNYPPLPPHTYRHGRRIIFKDGMAKDIKSVYLVCFWCGQQW